MARIRAMARPSVVQLLLGSFLVVVISFLAVLGYGLIRQPEQFAAAAGVNSVGHAGRVTAGAAPDFRLDLYQGGQVSLSGLRGKPVVLNFWASWCVPCRQEAPVFEREWQRDKGRGVAFVGLDVWDSESAARSFLKEFQIDYPNGVDPQAAASLHFGVTGVPETFFIKPDGRIATHWIGPLDDGQLSTYIEQVLPTAR